MEQVTWHKTQFVDMHLSDLVFDGELSHVSFENCGFKRVQFQHATLINSFFKGRKLSGIKFIQSKADRITYEFLKNGGADLTGLEKIE